MLKTKIKASQTTNLTDARYFAAWGVDWLGFNLDLGSDTYIMPSKMKEIIDWVEGPTIVGEFGLQSVETIQEAVQVLNLKTIQVGNFFEASALADLEGVNILKEVVVSASTSKEELISIFDSFQSVVEVFILDFSKSNLSWQDLKTEKILSLQFLKSLCEAHQVLLNINIPTDEIHELLETINPHGLSVVGGEEEQIGVKSFDDLDDLFETLEVFED